jgi:hypothetical protein
MSEMRTRYGGSGAISFSDLYDCEGFVITAARYYESSKFFTANNDGWSARSVLIGVFGSITPNESNGMVQFASNSYMNWVYEDNQYDPGITSLGLVHINDPDTFDDANGNNITAGYKGGNITRLVLANTSYSISSSGNTFVSVSYNMPNSGSVHCLVKF